jgi:protein TonB
VDRPDALHIPIAPVHYSGASGPIYVIPTAWQTGGDGKGTRYNVTVDFSKLDHSPKARYQVAPNYPGSLRNGGITGTVVVEFIVDKEGNVHDALAVRATNPGFIEAALQAVSRWKFEPGEVHGKRVRFRMSIPLVFQMDSM